MYIDIFLIILAVWAIFSGWRNGFIKELFSTLGVIVGLVIASVLYYGAPVFLSVTGSQTNMLLSIGMFIILCILLPLALGFIANRLTKAIKGLQLGLPNSLLGSGMAVIKFTLLISFALNIMSNLDILDRNSKKDSELYQPVSGILPFIKDEAQKNIPESVQMPDTIWVDFGNPDTLNLNLDKSGQKL